jgi:flagellar basal-body rod protein FlgB
MFESLDVSRMAHALAAHAGARMGLIARNVAQADTPGYKAVDLPDFASTYEAEGMAMRATRPGHLAGSQAGLEPILRQDGNAMSPDGNTVSLSYEMVKSVEARQSHDMAISIYRNVSDIVRTSLGKR